MKRLKRGEIMTALFFKDKPRAGLIVRSSNYADSENVTLCPITSTLAGGPLRALIKPGASGLERESEVVPYRVTTLPVTRIGEVIGYLTETEMEEVSTVLRDWMAL